MSWDARRNLLFNASFQMAMVVFIVVFANTFISQHVWRLDVTRQRLHSLDDASKAIVGKLDKPLVIKAWFTKGLEAPYNNHEQIFRDKLAELAAYSKGQLQLTVVDPATDSEALKEAQKYGLQTLDYTVQKADRSELRKIWMGAALLYGDRQEVLPSLTDMTTLEYELVAAIHRLQQKAEDRPVIGIATGHSEPDFGKPEGPMRTMVEGLAKKAVLTPIPLGGPGAIPKEVDALLIVGPQRPYSDRALYQVDQFLMRGGAVGVFLMNMRPDLRNYRATPVVSGLAPLLGHYGVVVGRNVVVDRVANGSMRFPVRQGGNSSYRELSYPLIPRATELSRESLLTSGLEQMLFPFTCTLSPAAELPPGVQVEVLAKTSASAGAVQGLSTVDPTQLAAVLPDEERGPFGVMVSVNGALRSFFETRPVPGPEEGMPSADGKDFPEERALTVEGATTRMVIAGSADMVANNIPFMLNLADWLVQDTALIGIRSKNTEIPPIPATSSAEQAAWKGFNLLLGPGVLLGYGALRQLRRRRQAGGRS